MANSILMAALGLEVATTFTVCAMERPQCHGLKWVIFQSTSPTYPQYTATEASAWMESIMLQLNMASILVLTNCLTWELGSLGTGLGRGGALSCAPKRLIQIGVIAPLGNNIIPLRNGFGTFQAMKRDSGD